MAHNLNFNKKTGTYSFASHAEKAWHGLGQVVKNVMTWQEAMELANMNYEVNKSQACIMIETPSGIVFPEFKDRFGTYRTDTNDLLGMVSDRYEIVQNKDAFTFFDSIIDAGEAIFETAGVLGNGEKIFVTAKLPEDMLVNGEVCEKYIILTSSHDGTSGIIAGLTTVRIVCNNTLQAALSSLSNKVSIRHTMGAKERLSEAYKVMGIASIYMTEVESIFNKMANVGLEKGKLKEYIFDVMKPEYVPVTATEEEQVKISANLINKVDSIFDFAMNHPTQNTAAAGGTVWGAYNAISGYYNFIKEYKTDEQKFTNQMFGNDSKKIAKAFDKALQLI